MERTRGSAPPASVGRAGSWGRAGATGFVGLLLVAGLFGLLDHPASASAPGLHAATPAPSAAPRYSVYHDCDGMYWTSAYPANYSPSFCYGHDEPTMSYLSNVNGSGANASFPLVLPSDSSSYAQGDFYATIWFGGTVYDTASTGGGNQAFLELQFYPAAPYYTGTGSGTKDCLPDGAYSPSFSAGTNKWFACAIVWQLVSTSSGLLEDAAFAGPIDAGASSTILTMKSNDQIFVNFTGIAQSSTVPWNISVSDASAGTGGWALLKNGSLVLSPYYATAASGNTLKWGASNPGAIAFAYEIGHAYIVAGCSPGDGACDSYWPGRWASSGQLHLSLPTVGRPGAMSFPSSIALSSSQGGEYEVNSSTCGSPSFSTTKNCLYPFFLYRSGSYSFDFGTTVVANATHTYRAQYQFPATLNGAGQWNANTQKAPWGTVHFIVYPSNATAQFNPLGRTLPLALGAGRSATNQYPEGPYWLNVSAAGCSSSSTPVYVGVGGSYNLTVLLACGGSSLVAHASASPTSGTFPLTVAFNGSATGGTAPYAYSWTFGDGGSSLLSATNHTYSTPGNFTASLIVSDANGSGSLATVSISVQTPSCAGVNRSVAVGSVQYCHLNKGQHATFRFTISKSDWIANGWIDVSTLDGKTTGTQPVFKTGTGMGGTPSLTAAKQKKAGPNAVIMIGLFKQAANRYGGWGTYWVYVIATGGSGGFCLTVAFPNGSTPGCSGAVAGPLIGGGSGGSGSPSSGGTPASDDGVGPSAGPSSAAVPVAGPTGSPGFLGRSDPVLAISRPGS